MLNIVRGMTKAFVFALSACTCQGALAAVIAAEGKTSFSLYLAMMGNPDTVSAGRNGLTKQLPAPFVRQAIVEEFSTFSSLIAGDEWLREEALLVLTLVDGAGMPASKGILESNRTNARYGWAIERALAKSVGSPDVRQTTNPALSLLDSGRSDADRMEIMEGLFSSRTRIESSSGSLMILFRDASASERVRKAALGTLMASSNPSLFIVDYESLSQAERKITVEVLRGYLAWNLSRIQEDKTFAAKSKTFLLEALTVNPDDSIRRNTLRGLGCFAVDSKQTGIKDTEILQAIATVRASDVSNSLRMDLDQLAAEMR